MPQFHELTTEAVRWCWQWSVTIVPQPDTRLEDAQTALNEAKALGEEGRYAEAIARVERALVLRQEVLGERHVDVTHCLSLLGVLYFRQGEFTQARRLLQRGLRIRRGILGRNHPDVADLLNGLGVLYLSAGRLRLAEPLLLRARAICEVSLRRNHPWMANVLTNLGTLYHHKGHYARARSLYEHASVIDEGEYGSSHPRRADLLDHLASLYKAQGSYGRAEALCARALAIRESALGRNHATVADSLNNLALLYVDKGLYEKAEPLYERALAVREAALGKEHLGLVPLLNNLANLHKAQGLYERAQSLYARALAVAEAALGKAHPDVAAAVTNLATLFEAQGLYEQALPLYERALRIQKGAFGSRHPSVALTLHNLADLLRDQGEYAQAKVLYAEAIALREQLLGGQHPLVACSLAGLATVHREQGVYERAEPLYERALATQLEALGEGHPDTVEMLNGFGLLRLAQGRLADALPFFARAFASSEQRLRREALGFSEGRLASFLQLLRAREEQLYALLRMHLDDAAVRHLVLGAALLLKGRSLDEMASISRIVHQDLEGEDWRTFEQLRALRTQLATLSLQGPGALSAAEHRQRLKELVEQGDALEALLARHSAPLRARVELPSLDEMVERVAQGLPRDAVLVEFISYVDRPLVPEPGTPRSLLPSEPRYLALVLFPDARTHAVDLGPAEPIDAAASRLRSALANRDAAFQDVAEELYTRVFQPLLPLLEGRRHLFLSPDGQLSLVPFAVLHDGNQFLADAYALSYLTSGNDLLPRPENPSSPDSVVVLADPDLQDQEAVQLPWAPLPGTRQEAEALQRLMPQAQLFLGAKASRERLLDVSAPGVLHLATHGFFLEEGAVAENSRAVGHFGALGADAAAPRPADPLLRSGLVLAREGSSGAEGSCSCPAHTMMVTALEVAGLDLWGTQLVVLSACDTGRGEVKPGQGVYGLRRAFVTAGAETVVMSLWKVSDDTTRELMEAYYVNLLAGQGRASALDAAMRALRERQPHPHYWAPFIAVGRDAPLR